MPYFRVYSSVKLYIVNLMKSSRVVFGFIAIFLIFSKSYGQLAPGHGLHLDDGLGHFVTLVGSNPGATFTFPANGGEILTFAPGGISPIWLCTGNTTPVSSYVGTISATDFSL